MVKSNYYLVMNKCCGTTRMGNLVGNPKMVYAPNEFLARTIYRDNSNTLTPDPVIVGSIVDIINGKMTLKISDAFRDILRKVYLMFDYQMSSNYKWEMIYKMAFSKSMEVDMVITSFVIEHQRESNIDEMKCVFGTFYLTPNGEDLFCDIPDYNLSEGSFRKACFDAVKRKDENHE